MNLVPLKMWGFFLQILVASMVLMANTKKRKYYWLRVLLVAGLSFPLYWLPTVPIWKFNINYVICLIILFPTGYFLYEKKTFSILFGTMGSFGLQHLAWNLLLILAESLGDLGPSFNVWLIQLIMILIFGMVYGIMLLFVKKLNLSISYSQKQFGSFLAGSIIFIIAFFLSQLVDILYSWNIIYRFYTSLCALLGLIIMLGYPYLSELSAKEGQLEEEKKVLADLLTIQAHQQQLSKETTDIVDFSISSVSDYQINSLTVILNI